MSEDRAERGAISAPAGCPVASWFNPNETGAHPDPFPWYQQVRDQGRVFFVPMGDDGFGMYVVSRYEEITEVLRDAVTYSNAQSLGTKRPAPAEIREEAGEDWNFPIEATLTLNDPPDHTRLRKLLAPTFTPRRIAAFEDTIRDVADGRIDTFVTRGAVDLASEFAYQIPNKIIARILGADDEAADRFPEWAEAFLRVRLEEEQADDELMLRSWRLLLENYRFGLALIEDRRRNPADDLTTDMIRATSDDGAPALSDEEILANTLSFIGAGSETSAISILHTMYLLLSHPQQWDEVRSDRSLIAPAIEEALRLRAPVRGLVRVATKDVELGGVQIPEGAHVYLNMASANHDDEVFERPHDFDIHRPDLNQHLAFGKWAHFCVGAPLARLEARVAIETLIDRLPSLRLAPDYERDFGYHNSLVLPRVTALRVEWG